MKRAQEGCRNGGGSKRRRLNKRVRFGEPVTFRVKHVFAEMTLEEIEALRSQLWYLKTDFDAFLRDRLETLRVWRAVGGNARLMEPNYSLRGLEAFQSSMLNEEMHVMRTRHLQAVLHEQERQRLDTTLADDGRLAEAAGAFSLWASQRARRLGLKDELEARSTTGRQPLPMTHHKPVWNLNSPFCGNLSKFGLASASTRQSLANMRSLCFAPRLPAHSVDVSQLKQMNAQFLQQLASVRGSLPRNRTVDLLTEALETTSTVWDCRDDVPTATPSTA